jgi:hypothetical protein
MLAVQMIECPQLQQVVRRLVSSIGVLLAAAMVSGCGRPFNVKTQPGLPPTSFNAKASIDELTIEARLITDEDFLYDTFDANLISAGLLPVRVMLNNSGADAVELSRARFTVEGQSTRFKAVDSRRAFKRLISYYGIAAYTKAGYIESLDAFSSYALDVKTPLAGNQTRQGLLFFAVTADGARQPGWTLVIDKIKANKSDPSAVSLKLN